ncbi:unnamed protein product [Moneuplotes crassus]|uniref:AP2/ERF domain-containing protein n=1 Tax=Euplotes crassus TaxID=5936 RepID=A0AAD2D808_EUPCR|nr:unnamed protein product [Moneuplotes crassus]
MKNNYTPFFEFNGLTKTEQGLFVSDLANLAASSCSQLDSLMKAYCLCEVGHLCCRHSENVKKFGTSQRASEDDKFTQDLAQCNTHQQVLPTSTIHAPARNLSKHRGSLEYRTAYLQNNLSLLYQQLEAVEDPLITIVGRKPKIAASRSNGRSHRRSRFTGVFKNTVRWQALIDILGNKTYISTHSTEQEAARAYDLMSLLLKGLRASTNFNYSKNDVLELFTSLADIVRKFCS